MSTTQPPLTAVEWLRVTHAGTLSGRRIEEALADAERRGERRVARAMEALAEEWHSHVGEVWWRDDHSRSADLRDALAAATTEAES